MVKESVTRTWKPSMAILELWRRPVNTDPELYRFGQNKWCELEMFPVSFIGHNHNYYYWHRCENSTAYSCKCLHAAASARKQQQYIFKSREKRNFAQISSGKKTADKQRKFYEPMLSNDTSTIMREGCIKHNIKNGDCHTWQQMKIL